MADKKPDQPTDDAPEPDDTPDYQAEIDKWKALAQKHEKRAKENYEELETLKADQDSTASDTEKLKKSIADLQSRAAKAEREALVARVAQAKKLPAFIAERLKGESLEDLEAEADEAISALGLSESEKDDDKDDQDDAKSAPGAKSSSLSRPKEKLRSGSSNDDSDGEFTVEQGDKIAASILNPDS